MKTLITLSFLLLSSCKLVQTTQLVCPTFPPVDLKGINKISKIRGHAIPGNPDSEVYAAQMSTLETGRYLLKLQDKTDKGELKIDVCQIDGVTVGQLVPSSGDDYLGNTIFWIEEKGDSIFLKLVTADPKKLMEAGMRAQVDRINLDALGWLTFIHVETLSANHIVSLVKLLGLDTEERRMEYELMP